MDNVERLMAIEEIKALKGRYCRCVDTQAWNDWRECFVPEVLLIAHGFEQTIHSDGIDQVVDNCIRLLDGATTVHQVHNPEIAIHSATQATGIWALHDILKWPRPNMFGLTSLVGYGNYHEKYVKTAQGWRISECIITRYYQEEERGAP